MTKLETTRITRVEVITNTGRDYVNWEDDNDVSYQLQDDGQTLKVFVNKVKPKSPVEEAYKDWWGQYPETGTWDGFDEERWQGFQAGYEFAYAISTAKEVMEQVQEEQKWDVVRESVKWCKEHPNESVEDYLTPKTPEKSKINDLAEKLLPDDHPYKIADEHGETNPYKQYLNSVEDEKKMEELGFVKNSDGNWTAQPLVETSQEEVEKLQEKEWNVDVKTEWHHNEWKSVALHFGEKLVSISPYGYYDFTPDEWLEWIINTYEKLCDDTVNLLKQKSKKRKIDDLAEKLLPDDHPYKITDEHGETTR